MLYIGFVTSIYFVYNCSLYLRVSVFVQLVISHQTNSIMCLYRNKCSSVRGGIFLLIKVQRSDGRPIKETSEILTMLYTRTCVFYVCFLVLYSKYIDLVYIALH